MYRNEKGVTLLEVLAVITILAMIGVSIWNVFFQGYQFSNKTVKKSQLQQEANIVITSMMNFHRQSVNPYQINVSDCNITMVNGSERIDLENTQICLSANFSGKKTIDPNNENLKLTVIASDRNDPNNKVTIETVLSRLKSGD